MKYWEIIADNLSKAGWSWGLTSAIDSNGPNDLDCRPAPRRWKAFVVHADEKLTALLELESTIRAAERQRIAEGVK